MNDDEWQQAYGAQYDGIGADLAALRAAGDAAWQSARMLVVRCGECYEALGEVMRTSTFPVLRTHEMAPSAQLQQHDRDHPFPEGWSELPRDEKVAFMLARSRAGDDHYWKGAAKIVPLPRPPWLERDLPSIWASCCSCHGEVTLPQSILYDALRRGEHEVTIPR